MIRGAYTPSFRIKQHPSEDAGMYMFLFVEILGAMCKPQSSMELWIVGVSIRFEENKTSKRKLLFSASSIF